MTINNIHGLPRAIPSDVKRVVRQRCGFGCVICGFGFYDYEHFAPDFVDAHEHNPDGMTLLCPNCNQKRARNRLSRESVAIANQNPACIRKGYANEMFDFHSDPITIKLGGLTFYNCEHLIKVNGRSILSVLPPREVGSPVLLSGIFCDSLGRTALTIKENEWSASIGNWDVECVGPRITIRSAPRNIVLSLKMEPPHGIIIDRIEMLFDGVRFRGGEDKIELSMDGKSWHTYSGVSMSHSEVAIYIQTTHIAANDPVWDEI